MPKVTPQTKPVAKPPLRGGIGGNGAAAAKPITKPATVVPPVKTVLKSPTPLQAPVKPTVPVVSPVAKPVAKVVKPEPAKAIAKPKPKVEESLPVLYPKLDICVCCVGKDSDFACRRADPLTVDDMKGYLGWEPLSEFKERMKVSDEVHEGLGIAYKDMTPEQFELAAVFDPDQNCVITDANGEQVCCWNNKNNRMLQESGYKKYAQDILMRSWAGPNTMTGEVELTVDDGTPKAPYTRTFPLATVNGEPIIISRTGQCQSIQHRGIGFVYAYQLWENSGPDKPGVNWRDLWPEAPVFETVLVLGTSDSEKVVSTLDNVLPRSEADVIFTSDIFKGAGRGERKLVSAMLASARELLWNRTGAGKPGAFAQFLTNSTKQQFYHAHESLKDCVKHLFRENKDRAFSIHGISPGQAAGMMYLMGSSMSDPDEYRNDLPRCEKGNSGSGLDWSNWDKAVEFWQYLAKGLGAKIDTVAGRALRDTVRPLVDAVANFTGGVGSNQAEKQVILARAWSRWMEENELDESVGLSTMPADEGGDWVHDQNGMAHFIPQEPREFGGIDLGPKVNMPKTATVTPADVEAQKDADRAKLAEESQANVRKLKGKPETLAEEAARLLKEKEEKRKASGRPLTRREVEAEQTARAAAHDAEDEEVDDEEDEVIEDTEEGSDEA